jgi:probable rRNA maturation factor
MPIAIILELKGHQLSSPAWARLLKFYLAELGHPKATLSLVVAGDARIRALNRRWRGLDQATDVLSFPAVEGRVRAGFTGHLGDLALDWPYVRRSFPRFEGSLSRELSLLLAHGCLHLTGHHHDTPAQEAAMWRLQRRLLASAGAKADKLPAPVRLSC